MKRKRWAAWVLALLLVLQLSAMPTQAASHVYFLGAQENILPVSDATMPFWQSNYLYVPSTAFSGAARDSLGVSYSQGSDGSWVAMYRSNQALLFKKGVGYGEDQNGRRYYPGAVERNGILFVPAGVVASFFDLKYSIRTVDNGTLVWMRTKEFILTESIFADAASGVMEMRYQEYLESLIPPETEEPSGTEPPGAEPEKPITGKNLYLCARGTDNTAGLLDTLDRYESQMTFFCTAEFMAKNHDLLRRMAATGQGIGLLAEEGEGFPPVTEQLEAANRELEQATLTRTRLVRVEQARPETLTELMTLGYCPAASTLGYSRSTLATANQANSLFRTMTASRNTVAVWLDGAVSSTGLTTFLTQTIQAEDPCIPLRETTEIR